ncbi:hypothetical protein SAMN02745146_3058 [Hymenobacter daecheongensis DSM 21074]|uniref:Uncharacterized protein n=1 Tax=Hymenobacter daecheongensis DSM 21074 TaxID=1121955 RepID=A0A1M6J1L7_9BACT|nr:hypothetical protein [Hymenobacter daecheongensis]SHJ40610.1 hypothetical protein SAMN02745146_3058 [Hymenobacter daecheongensis DSM 21074]
MSQLLPVVGPDSPETRSIITIQKVKVKDQHLTCEFIEQRSEEAPPRAFALTCTEQVHPDLTHALSRLVPHLCLLAEQLTETTDYWPDESEELPTLFEPFTVTGFSMGRNQGGVTLIGQRELAAGRVLNLTTPYQSFDDEQASYPYTGLLETTLATALVEVEAALRGKCTEYRQLDLFEQPATTNVLLVPTPPRA